MTLGRFSACWIAGLALIWISVAVITVGTHLQTMSPRFAEYERHVIAREAGIGEGERERQNPAGRMALVLTLTWQFSCCFSGFIALLYTAGVFGIRAIGRRHHVLAILLAGGFGLGCIAGAVLGIGDAIGNFLWEFITLGIGYLLSSAGLVVGGLGVAGSIMTKRS